MRIVVKEDLCSGCLTCVAACSLAKTGFISPSSSCVRVETSLFSRNHIILCRQCANAPCARACPEGAIERRSESEPWVIDQERCNGCRKCIEACPFGAIFYDPVQRKVIKCDLCGGGFPACVDACPTEALSIEDK